LRNFYLQERVRGKKKFNRGGEEKKMPKKRRKLEKNERGRTLSEDIKTMGHGRNLGGRGGKTGRGKGNSKKKPIGAKWRETHLYTRSKGVSRKGGGKKPTKENRNQREGKGPKTKSARHSSEPSRNSKYRGRREIIWSEGLKQQGRTGGGGKGNSPQLNRKKKTQIAARSKTV